MREAISFAFFYLPLILIHYFVVAMNAGVPAWLSVMPVRASKEFAFILLKYNKKQSFSIPYLFFVNQQTKKCVQ